MSTFSMTATQDKALELIRDFDHARIIPAHVDSAQLEGADIEMDYNLGNPSPQPDMVMVPDWQFVVNDRSHQIVNAVSDRYALIQHEFAANLFMEGLAESGLGETARYSVINNGDSFRIRARFPGIKVPDGSSGGLNIGVQFENSYDSTASLKGKLLVWRMVCSNGLFINRAIPGTTFYVRHIGGKYQTDETVEKMRKYILKLANATSRVRELVEISRNIQIVFGNVREVQLTIQDILNRIRLPAEIVDAVPIGEPITTYDLLNTITYYASNGPVKSEAARENMISRASARLFGVEEFKIVTEPEAPREATTV